LNTTQSILNIAKSTIKLESKSIANLAELLTDDFAKTVALIYNSKGRVIITGIGKSAIIANKIVATLNSTGTPSIFMHAADAIHDVEQEACPNNLAPTTSTTAQLVMGDALAVCLLELRGFSSKDFAKYHPGGALGKRLYLRVNDLSSQNQKPQVNLETTLKEVIVEITNKMLGVTAVVEDTKIVGIITDGDLRRMLSNSDDISGLKAKDIMSTNPRRIAENAMAVDAKEVMEEFGISQLLVEHEGKYAGVVHLHDLIKEGII